MKITLEAIQVLAAIERCGTFARAAKELHRVPSALTYTINQLETQLNAKIFDRRGHRAQLTEFGRLLLKEGQELLINAQQLEHRLVLHQKGFEETLRVAYDQIIPFGNLTFLIAKFCQQYPEINLKWSGEILGGCWDALLSNRASIAIGVTGDPPMREDFSLLAMGQIEFVFVMSKNHPLASKRGPLENKDLVQYRIVAVADSTRTLKERTSGILPHQPLLTVNTFFEKITAIRQGLGVGFLPLLHAKPYIDAGELIVKDAKHLKSKGTISLAWRPSLIGTAGQWLIKKLSEKAIIYDILTPKK